MADVCFQKPEVVISAGDWNISPKLGLQVDSDIPYERSHEKAKSEVELWCRGRHLGKWLSRRNPVTDGSIWTNFSRQMQNDTPMVMQTRKSKPKVEYQHGGRLFQETESSNSSTVYYVTEISYADRFRPL